VRMTSSTVRNDTRECLNVPRCHAEGSPRQKVTARSAVDQAVVDALELRNSDPFALLAILVGVLVALFLLLPPAHATSWPTVPKSPTSSCFAPPPHTDKLPPQPCPGRSA